MRLFGIYQAIMGCGGSPAPARPRASWLPGAEAGRGGKLETLERQAVRASECLGKPWERLPPNSLVLVKQHGQDAPIHAAMRADAMLEVGDLDGYAAWKRRAPAGS